MKLLMSDVPIRALEEAPFRREENKYVCLSRLKIANCMGCFGCWVKTPGKCVIRDDAVSVYPLIAGSEEIVYVTEVRYGCYGTVMKTMLERSIPVQKAFIRLHQGETHHCQRRVAEKNAAVIAYGNSSEEERRIFEQLVSRNAKNMLFRSWRLRFVSREEAERAALEEVKAWEK